MFTLRAGDDAVDDGVTVVAEVLAGLRKLATDEDVSVWTGLPADSLDERERSLADLVDESSRSGARGDGARGRCVGSSALRQRRRSRTVADDDSRHAAVPALNVSSSASPGDSAF